MTRSKTEYFPGQLGGLGKFYLIGSKFEEKKEQNNCCYYGFFVRMKQDNVHGENG